MKAAAFALSLVLSTSALAQAATPSKAEQSTLARTDPRTWSKHGWQKLKWGMGPGDAKRVLQLSDLEPGYYSAEYDGLQRFYYAAYPELIFGMNVVIELGFSNERLDHIQLLPDPGGLPLYIEAQDRNEAYRRYKAHECGRWESEVRSALKARYGDPICDLPPTVYPGCRYRKHSEGIHVVLGGLSSGPTRLSVTQMELGHSVCRFGVVYTDLGPILRDEARQRQQEIDKL